MHGKLAISVEMSDLVSDGTNLLELVDILQDRTFCFVLRERRIAGYIHFSDLNNPLVKLSFYITLEALERRLVQAIAPHVSEESIQTVLGPGRAWPIRRYMQKQRANEAHLNWTSLLLFRDVLNFARYVGTIHLAEEDLRILSDVRNTIAHASRLLIEKHEDVTRLATVRRLCSLMLRQLDTSGVET